MPTFSPTVRARITGPSGPGGAENVCVVSLSAQQEEKKRACKGVRPIHFSTLIIVVLTMPSRGNMASSSVLNLFRLHSPLFCTCSACTAVPRKPGSPQLPELQCFCPLLLTSSINWSGVVVSRRRLRSELRVMGSRSKALPAR